MLSSQLPSSLSFDHLVGLIALVGDQHLGDILVGMLVNLLEPVLNVVEGLLVSAVVDQDDAHRSFVVSLSDGAEPFLTGSIPHLQLHALVVDIDLLDLEVNA